MSVSEITVKKRKARLIEKLRRMLGRDIDSYLIFFYYCPLNFFSSG